MCRDDDDRPILGAIAQALPRPRHDGWRVTPEASEFVGPIFGAVTTRDLIHYVAYWFLVSDVGVSESPERRLSRFATVNKMESCGTPGDAD